MAQSVSSTQGLFLTNILEPDEELARSKILQGICAFGLGVEQATEYADEFMDLLRLQRAFDDGDDTKKVDIINKLDEEIFETKAKDL